MTDLKNSISNDSDNIKENVEKLKASTMKIGQYMYNNQQQQQKTENSAENQEAKSDSNQNDEQKK